MWLPLRLGGRLSAAAEADAGGEHQHEDAADAGTMAAAVQSKPFPGESGTLTAVVGSCTGLASGVSPV